MKTFGDLIEKGIIVLCDECKGSGKTHGYGAFGEPASYVCSRCKGQKYILNVENINKDILSESTLERNQTSEEAKDLLIEKGRVIDGK